MAEEHNQTIKLHIRQVVREAQNVLSNKSTSPEIVETLQQMTNLLPGNTNKNAKISEQEQKEFMNTHYSRWIEFLTSKFTVDWMGNIPKGQSSNLVDIFFLQGIPDEAFIVLCRTITSCSPSYKLNKCVSLIETFLHECHLQELLWKKCKQGAAQSGAAGARQKRADPSLHLWQELITYIATLPDRVLNKLQKETSETFYPMYYIPMVTRDVHAVLQKVHAQIGQSKDCSVEFISQLIGKLCLIGYGDKLWSVLLPMLVPVVSQDFVWSRVCERIVTSVPDSCLESVILPLLMHCTWYGLVSKFLGQSVISSQKMQFLLTNKFILLKHFEQELILQNIIGYLASSPSRKHLHIKLLKSLLRVWGDASAVKHTSYEQHKYLTKAILIASAFMEEKDKIQLRTDVLEVLLGSVQVHLDSSSPRLRTLGMVVAESLTAALDPTGNKLQFEYEKDEEIQQLLKLLTPPEDPSVQNLQSQMGQALLNDMSETKDEKTENKSESEMKSDESELDSDDDLEPFDMSNDVKYTTIKSPLYLRDCMEGLLSSDKPDQVEACIIVAEKLIRSHPSSVKEIAVEFSKVLVHLEDKFSLPGFSLFRHKSMVALAVTSPIQVAEYLTGEFYERNYNLRQRMDMLQVLGEAAQELSQPTDSALKSPPTSKITEIPSQAESEDEPQHWRDIVQQRIDKKTRRFAHGRTRPLPTPVPNKFAPVAGQFFFPLLRNFDKREMTLDLLGEDHIILGRLVYTLGIVMYAATNAPVARQIGTSLLEFIWVLRYHTQPSVRNGLLFAISMVMLSVPSHILLTDLQGDMMEAKIWLQGVVEKDTDGECRKMALQALMLLENIVRKEFEEPQS